VESSFEVALALPFSTRPTLFNDTGFSVRAAISPFAKRDERTTSLFLFEIKSPEIIRLFLFY